MIVNGKHLPNVTCGRCRFRHPANMTCEQARKAAEAARPLPTDSRVGDRARELCDQFDAAIFSGDGFIEPEALEVLEEHLGRWWRALRERAPSPYLPDPDLIRRRNGTLVALLRTGKLIRGGLSPEEMATWAKQVENVMRGDVPPTPEKDPLLC